MLFSLFLTLEQIHEGAQLQAGDVRPAATLLHPLQQVEQVIAIGRQAAAEGTVLDAAVQVLQLTQQFQQGLGVTTQLCRQLVELADHAVELLLLALVQTHRAVCSC